MLICWSSVGEMEVVASISECQRSSQTAHWLL